MRAGKGAVPEVGYEMVTEKEMEFPWSETLMFRVVPDKDAVTVWGLGGFVPSSFVWNNWLISAWRHVKSLLVVTFAPETFVNGSLSLGTTGVGLVVRAEHVPVCTVPDVEVVIAVVVPELEVGGFPGVLEVEDGRVLVVVVVRVLDGVLVAGRHWE
jgi:hypothetical protein